MGTQVRTGLPTPGSELDIRLTIQDDDEPTASYDVDVYSDIPGGDPADIVRTVTVSGNGTHVIDGVTFEGVGQYVYLRLRQDADEAVAEDRAWTAPVWFDGGAGPAAPTGASAVVLTVDPVLEEASVSNLGAASVDIGGWRIFSVEGGQEFFFPNGFQLGAGATVVVLSRPGATAGPGQLLWSPNPRRVWNNDGDPGELYTADGTLVSETGRD